MNLHIDQKNIEGNWWTADQPTIKWHGVLSLKAGKAPAIQLTNYGHSLASSAESLFARVFKVLHGTSTEGKAITLIHCVNHSITRTFATEGAEYTAFVAIFGAHILEDDLNFDGVRVELDYLNDWVSYSRFQSRDVPDEKEQREIRIKLNSKYEFPFDAENHFKGSIFLGYSTHTSVFKFSIESRSNLSYTYYKAQPLKSILRDLKEWKWLISLGTEKPGDLLSLVLFKESNRFSLGKESFPTELEVWISSDARENPKVLHDFQMLFSFPSIEDRFSSIIDKWKAMQVPWAPVLEGYFSVFRRSHLSIEEMFLLRARAVEGLYWIRNGAENTSRQCYEDAWERSPRELQDKLGSELEFVSAVQRHRNHLVHFQPQGDSDKDDSAILFDLSQKLEFILKTAILAELGFNSSTIATAVSQRKWAQFISF